jgi:Tol biopolymer transport system component
MQALSCGLLLAFLLAAQVNDTGNTLLVNEPGWSTDPAISADGRWLAYASDRGGSQELHLWIQPLAGGQPRRLTEGAGGGREPAFAPDGKTIAYRGEAEGGGVFLIAADGGKPRLLAPRGRRPRFSPRGGSLVYWTEPAVWSSTRDSMFEVDPAVGRPRPFHPEFFSSRAPIWSPDGSFVLFAGCRDRRPESCDWWVSPPEGGQATALGAAKLLRQARLDMQASPELWLPDGTLVCSARSGEKQHLWKFHLTPDPWRVAGTPARLTSGDHGESGVALAPGGRFAIGRTAANIDVWSLPLRADHAEPAGDLARLTSHPSIDQRPALSLDGSKIAWETSRGGNFEVWAKNLATGEEKGLTSGPLREHMPAIAPDGSRLVYDAHDGEKVTVLLTRFDGGEPEKIWEENVGQGSFQWSRKGDALLYFHRAPPGSVGLLSLADKKRTVLLRHPSRNLSLSDARLSPDGRWIAFPVPLDANPSRLAAAPVAGKVIEDEKDWSYLTPEQFNAWQPEWSPNGRWLYFLSDQSGTQAVWAMRFSAGKPDGPPRLILDPGGRLSIAAMRPRDIGLAIATDKLALAITETTGGLWLVQGRSQ